MTLLLQDTLVISPATVQRIDAEIEEIKNNTDVADVVASKAELNAYDTSKLTDNAIIKVLQDESVDDASTYYRYTKSSDTFELIGSVGPYYTKAESDDIEEQIRQDFAAADTTLQNNITAEETRATGVEDQLRIDLTAEISDRENADINLQENINDEVTRATTTENTLTTNLNTEISNRESADTTLQVNIDTVNNNLSLEVTRATNRETELDGIIATHTSNTSNPHSVTKAQVGLGNVDNTSDANKPISTATQTALDNKLDKSNSASQVYGTDSTGAQTTYNVDSFGQVDDVQVNGTSIVSNKIANIDLTTKSGITLRVWGGNE